MTKLPDDVVREIEKMANESHNEAMHIWSDPDVGFICEECCRNKDAREALTAMDSILQEKK